MRRRPDIVDEIDLQLISILRSDSSRSLIRIAEELGVAEGTVRNRINRLKRTGVIKKFTVIVGPKIMGNSVVCFLLVNTAPGRVDDVAKRLSQLDSVIEVFQIHTFADLLLKIIAQDLSALGEFIASKVKTTSGIAGTQVVTVLKVWKQCPNF